VIRPRLPLTYLLAVPLASVVVGYFLPGFFMLAAGSMVLLVVVAVVDLIGLKPSLTAEREAPSTYAVGVRHHVDLLVHNTGNRELEIEVFDYCPPEHECDGLPLGPVKLPAGRGADFRYGYTPVSRGIFAFGQIQVRSKSPLGLWDRTQLLGEGKTIRVYPDYAHAFQSGVLAACQRLDAMGIHRRRQRGDGTDFHQLRHFRSGDRLNQINWKSTAKHRALISNEYQEERDQRVMILLDCSHRMRSRDGALSHFDQALNAAILLAWFATRQSDAAGLLTFGSEESRYVQPAKTPAVVSKMLDAMFDLYPSDQAPDYRQTFQRVLTTMRKRSLIVVVTTLRDDAAEDMRLALAPLMARHLVLVANIREAVIDEVSAHPVQTGDDALTYLGAQEYASGIDRTLKTVRASGCSILSTKARDLPIAVTNYYLDLKRAGRI
jgi:uncharacterized protein (DUF58 family)